MKLRPLSLFLGVALLYAACTSEPAEETPVQASHAELLIFGGPIYTSDEGNPTTEMVAVAHGKIIGVGTRESLDSLINEETAELNLQGKTMIPGFIESHAHILGLGKSQRILDLTRIKNYDELVDMVAAAVAVTPKGEWIEGRGWHQSKWNPQPEMVTGYQTHEKLSAVSPDHPVYLTHASGHASFANAKAMEMAGIGPETEVGEGGEILRNAQGEPTGIFSETAQGLIRQHIPETTRESRRLSLEAAIQESLANGITSFQNAGAGAEDVAVFQEFVEEDKMDIRLWTMLSGGDTTLLQEWYENGPLVGDRLTVRSIKLYADGALGSRGAWLIKPYEDRPQHYGNPIMPLEYIHEVSADGLEHGFQVCVHAIGDRANREVLNQFEKAFETAPETGKKARFRVEHAQHLHPDDIPRFSELGVIASMQGIHMSSDRPWAIDRLGPYRIQTGAYVWAKLLESGARVINGTDAPVEPVSPIASFYASISRKTLNGLPEGGYEAEQAMTRPQALKSYTLDAAYGAFEEKVKGSIEVGKFADFTVLSKDIMQVPESEVLQTEIEMTIVDGEVKYQKGD